MDTPHAPTLDKARLLQFSYFFGLGAGVPFLTLYFKYSLRTPEGEPATYLIGILFFIQSILIVVSSPVAGILGDLFRAHHRVISFYSVLVTIGSLVMAVPGMWGISMELSTAFILMFIGISLNGLFNRPLVPLIDTETLHALHSKYGNSDGYGGIRLYGSIAWIFSSTLFGFILWITDNLTLSVLGYGAVYLVLAFIAWNADHARPHISKLPWEYLARDKLFRRFLIFAFLASFPVTGSYQFTSYYMDDLHINLLLIGLSMGLAALPEIPIFKYSQQIIGRFGSSATILIGLAFLLLKLICFYLLPQSAPSAFFLAIQMIHGVGWAFMYAGIVRYIDSLAHPDLRGTYQNLYTVPWTVSNALSGLATAWMVQAIGSRLMMGVQAILLLAAMLYFILFVLEKRPPETARAMRS